MDIEESNLDQPVPTTSVEPKLGRYTFWDGLITGLSVLVAQFVVAIPAVIIALILGGRDSENMMSLTMGITLILAFPVAVWWVLRKRKLSIEAWVWKDNFLILLLLSFLMAFGTSAVVGMLLELFPNYEDMVEDYAAMFEGMNPILLFIGGAFIGPVCEEIIFRGIILKELLFRYNYKKAILFSSIIFSFIHMMPLQVIATFPIGLVLGYIYYKTNSLWIVSIIHILNNAVSFAMGTDDMASGETTREWFGNDLYFAGTLLLISIGVYLAYRFFERYSGNEVQSETSHLL